MTERGQVGIISVFFLLCVFIIIWALVLAPMISTTGQLAIAGGNLTGLEAFFAGNFNLIILFCIIIAMVALGVYGGRG